MPQAAVRKVSTNGGIMSPFLDGRIDLARYQTGCIEMTNQIPTESGLSVTRPGLIYDARLNRATVAHPYVVSASVSYLLLFSEYELRFVRDGQIIQHEGSDLVVTTPYKEADLYELKLDSLVDVTWVAHPDHEPMQLTRESETQWALEKMFALFGAQNPPMIPRAGETQTITPSHTFGFITLTSSFDLFEDGHAGSYWRVGYDVGPVAINQPLNYVNGEIVNSDSVIVQGDWAFTTSGNWRGTISIMRQNLKTFETEEIRRFEGQSELRNIATTGTEYEAASLWIRFVSNNDGSLAYNPAATIEASNSKIYGQVRIAFVVSATEAHGLVVGPALQGTDATDLWEEPAWSSHRGYPSAVSVHERRLMFAASRSFPNRYWTSRQDDRKDFQLGDDVQAAISFDLPSRDAISWMISDKKLILGTRREEVVISSGRDDLPLSPENSIARVNGSIGSSRVTPVKSSDSILYAERRGRRIREMVGDPASDVFTNTDITAFAPHLFDASVLQMASAQMDQKLVYVLLSNRKMLCINHNRAQALASWFVIETEGDFESVAALPGDNTEDVVYVVTRRTINGQEVRQLEHFAVDQWDLVEEGDPTFMVYSDMAKVVENVTPETEITGLDDWESMEVQILADGAVQPNQTVTGGKVTLRSEASVVVVGLPYRSVMTPMWFEDINTATQGRKRKVSKIYFSMYQGGNVTVSATDEDVLGNLEVGETLAEYEVARRSLSDKLGEAPKLENEYFEVSLESRHSRKQSVRFERMSPLPMNIQAIHTVYNVGEK